MRGELGPYPEYKESGQDWIGSVPGHWDVRRMKSQVLNSISQTTEMLPNDVYIALEHIEGWTGKIKPQRGSNLFSSQVKKFLAEDVLFGKLRPYLAKVGRLSVGGVCAGEFLVLRVSNKNNLLPSYLELQYRVKPLIDEINSSTFGAKMPRAEWKFIGNLLIPIPSISEQAAIVKYLSYATTRIDTTIKAKRKIIALLNEQKQAIIQRAITKGLDPNVRMKDSGVPWIGEIPEHWDIVRNMALFTQRIEPGILGLPVLQVSLRSGITMEETDQFGRKKNYISDSAKYKLIRKGDIAYNTMRMWQGAVGVSPSDGLVSPAYVVLKSRQNTCPAFYDYIFHTDIYKQQVNRQSTGIVSDRNRLYWDSFKQMFNIFLPHNEQEKIVAFITSKTDSIISEISRIEHEISLLREYRTRLVTDVVTGKLDVRAAAAELPDTVGEEVPDEVDEASEVADDEIGEEVAG